LSGVLEQKGRFGQAKKYFKHAIETCKKKDSNLLYRFALGLLREGAEMTKLLEDDSAIELAAGEAIPYIQRCLEVSPEDEDCKTLLLQAVDKNPKIQDSTGKVMTEKELRKFTSDKVKAAKEKEEANSESKPKKETKEVNSESEWTEF
jgi:tetratricopeptide (TPR) repeat protein